MMNEPNEQESLPSPEEFTAALNQMPVWEVDVTASEPPGSSRRADSEDEPRRSSKDGGDKPRRSPETTTEPAPPRLPRILEALLFVGGPPLTAQRAAEIIRGLSEVDFHQAIDSLARSYRAQNRPYHIQLQDHGYVLLLRPRFNSVREKIFGGVREARLSQQAVDVLSLVAYRQPATRQEIDSLRGADSAAILRLLIRHGLVALQRGEDRETRYATTPRFLQLFGLSSLDDLPQTQDLQRL
jgi:segregation and condensation protein B